MKPIWMTTAYKICTFLDEHPQAHDTNEIITQAVPKVPEPTVKHALRVLVRDGFIFKDGTMPIGKTYRTLFRSDGHSAARYEDFKEKEYAGRAHPTGKTKADATPVVNHDFILAALNAHPLHQWKGVQL